ncbi:MAG: CehA/McbA family metallohydrolase [Planctomyces sp.]|nr:CehA/McbA family metallohydrolase [Planctomyces sp.]
MHRLIVGLVLIASVPRLSADERPTRREIEPRVRHLRIDGPREWSSFPEQPEAASIDIEFDAAPNSGPVTLLVRQEDVKERWTATLNEQPLGDLVRDENPQIVAFDVPENVLRESNRLRIEQRPGGPPDDVRIGEIALVDAPQDVALEAGRVDVRVVDAATGAPIPCRLTILRDDGVLPTVAIAPERRLAIRAGTIYTLDGQASFGLPEGTYTVYAGRGFEYSLASARATIPGDDVKSLALEIRRETPMPGYVACDPHIHTLTHSGHGDATAEERIVTIAGEGLELAVATDHNVAIDYGPLALLLGARGHFTPVIGDEVTTRIGHFNAFPMFPGQRLPDHERGSWEDILNDIHTTPGVRIAILNHARDLHSDVRPFGPARFNSVVGEQQDGWAMRFNAMEILNSSATQSDPLQLTRDWMALLNRGRRVTPVGSSDSHDVLRHFVGQGRTYIRVDDSRPGRIDVDAAMKSFEAGRVLVSYGLIAELVLDGAHHAGDIAPAAGDTVDVEVRVLGPHWTSATLLRVYANGLLIRETPIDGGTREGLAEGVIAIDRWTLARPAHDVHLVAVATGPGIDESWWRTAKPYQPVSPDWEPMVLGVSGAVWLDVDGDGSGTPAHTYAGRLVEDCGEDLGRLAEALAGYDAAVAAQAALQWERRIGPLQSPAARAVWQAGAESVREGFEAYLAAQRETEIARQQGSPDR